MPPWEGKNRSFPMLQMANDCVTRASTRRRTPRSRPADSNIGLYYSLLSFVAPRRKGLAATFPLEPVPVRELGRVCRANSTLSQRRL
eukprot:scaffold3202_cov407-Prasinococcus_capsulatus_cf.AAC.5